MKEKEGRKGGRDKGREEISKEKLNSLPQKCHIQEAMLLETQFKRYYLSINTSIINQL